MALEADIRALEMAVAPSRRLAVPTHRPPPSLLPLGGGLGLGARSKGSDRRAVGGSPFSPLSSRLLLKPF